MALRRYADRWSNNRHVNPAHDEVETANKEGRWNLRELEYQLEGISLGRRLKRFLTYNSQTSIYNAGVKCDTVFHCKNSLMLFRELLRLMDIAQVLEIIEWVHSKKINSHVEIIPFVLSECCRIDNHKPIVLKFTLKLLRKSEEFLLFYKYCFEIDPKIRVDLLVKNMIREWYALHDSLDIADMVTENSTVGIWGHNIMLKLGHVESRKSDRAALYIYATQGLEKMNEKFRNDPEAAVIIKHFNRVNNFKMMLHPFKAAQEISYYRHSVRVTNDYLLNEKMVWKALLQQMDLHELHFWLPHLTNLSTEYEDDAMMWDQDFILHICDRIESLGAVIQSRISPCRSCIELQKYLNIDREKFHPLYSGQPIRIRYPINEDIVTALQGQLTKAIKNNIKPVKLNMTLVIICDQLPHTLCQRALYVPADIAAAVITLSLKNSFKSTKILAFDENDFQDLSEEKTYSSLMLSIEAKKCSETKPMDVSKILNFENKDVSETDLFVIIGKAINYGDYMGMVRSHEDNPREPKFVFCSLGERTSEGPDHSNILAITGFDDKVCSVIHAFVMEPFVFTL